MLNQINRNIQSLLTRYRINVTELARRTGISQPVLHRIVNGNTPNPRIETIIPVARYFGVTLGQLIGEEPLEINGAKIGTVRAVPHISLASLETWLSSPVQELVDYHLYQDNNMSERAFATTLIDTTMRPQFPEGTIILIDPEQRAYDQDFVLAQVPGHELPVFRQLIMDGRQAYLKALNPDFRIITVDHVQEIILGSFVLARVTSRRHYSYSDSAVVAEETTTT